MTNAFSDNALLQNTRILVNEPMRLHTTFKIGGNADYFAIPESMEAVRSLVQTAIERGIPYFIIGNGSNLLVSDKGFRGLVIQMEDGFQKVEAEGDIITAEAGILLSRLSRFALQKGLSGLEFASGIPGTLGGAVMMNAGAYGGEMSQVVTEVQSLTEDGRLILRKNDEIGFAYRHSAFSENHEIILKVALKLQKGDPDEIQATMTELAAKRREKQPLELPSAGSTFKRPEGYFAAKLIDDAGLRGFRIGGAQVSEKHAGFVVNTGDATASDIIKVMKHVKNTVEEKFGVTLEPEVRLVGEFEEEL